ncbi:hypothetical protein R16034_00025 [Ralstonia edaphis]|uniref:Uncharacterized protein n=1 Tax=Ralstonia edaphi TaxID=3058599 RepID=A0AB72X1Z5_9RALS|nr:hypothetical protein R16034_00025 [Ralstonia sp. LMG 6871]
MQSCKANCGGAAKLSQEESKRIANVLFGMVADSRPSLTTPLPARLTEVRETLARELLLLAEVTEPAQKGKPNKRR